MSYQNILLEQIEDGIHLLTINRPSAYNALNGATLDEIQAAAGEIADNPDTRVLLLTGAGDKAFVAGADIAEMQAMSALEGQQLAQRASAAMRCLELLRVPVIAVVNGYCLGGGCELAMCCDWIIASENAVFGQPEVNLGITPGFGGTQRLQRLIGKARAMELIVTGRHVKADEALQWGLVNHVYPPQQAMQQALQSARLIREKGPVAVGLAKQAVQRGQDLDLDNACLLESELFGLCFSTEDQKEGMLAFVEKRPPVFKAR